LNLSRTRSEWLGPQKGGRLGQFSVITFPVRARINVRHLIDREPVHEDIQLNARQVGLDNGSKTARRSTEQAPGFSEHRQTIAEHGVLTAVSAPGLAA